MTIMKNLLKEGSVTMSNLIPFNYSGKQIRVIEKDGQPWWVLRDVCEALGLDSPHKVSDRLEEDERNQIPITDSIGRGQYTTIVNEPGIYNVILRSDKPEAKQFKRWITHEVIPSIRKHGAYMTPETIEKAILNPDVIIDLATRIKEEQKKRIEAENKLEEQKPMVLFAQSVEASNDSILIGDLAKILKQNGVDIGQNRLFEILRKEDYLCKSGSRWNTPTQKAMELELFEVKETIIHRPGREPKITITTKVTGKGQVYFVKHFLSKKSA